METDRFQLLSAIFERVSALPAGDRAAALDAECNGDAALRAEVESLLHHADQPDDPVVTAAGLDALFEEAGLRPRNGQPIPDVVGGNSHHTPSTISGISAAGAPMPVLTGQYRIIRVIGEGGMGIVYEAEQAFPKRRVALKSIRPGLFSRRMLRRFQNEAHILGRLQHPGIAHIYEAGASDPQHPDDAFFVMEFVDGPPLTTYAEQKRLSTRQRLELMIQVCDAVHHAHQRGVIHRDIKPANILVAESGGENGDPQPKILDFGVARVTDDPSRTRAGAADSMHTHAGALVGTLAYMSPEQVSTRDGGDSGGVDVRTDVYALGVVLYQLLAGRLPLDLADKSIPDAAQMVRESEPSRLGTIDRTFRGDLETIVAKALEKDRTRRYQSAADLGDDIGRFLRGEAIAAKRDSAMYVFRKQVRRHKGPVAVGVVALVSLVVFAVVAATQARRNASLARALEDQLAMANSERARLLTVSGTPLLGERLMWTEHLQRPDLAETYWALWEYYSRQPILKSTGGPGLQPGPTVITPDCSTIIRVSSQGEMEGWSADLERCLWRTAGDARRCSDGAVAPSGRFAAFVGSGGKFIIVDPLTGAITRRIDAGTGELQCLAITPDSRTIYVGDRSGDIMEWDAETGRVVRRFASRQAPIANLALSPDGAILVAGLHNGVYSVYDVPGAFMAGNIPVKSAQGRRAQFSPDGGLFLLLASDGTVREYATSSFELVGKIATGDARSYTMVLLDDGTLVTSGDGGLRVWDLPTQSLRYTMPGSESSLGQLVKGPRPGTFYTTAMGTAIRLWETTPLNCSQRLLGGTRDWMTSLEPSPDGRWLVGADAAGVVRVWDAASGDLLGSCKGPAKGGRHVCFVPGRSEALIGFQQGTVGVFEITGKGPRLLDSWKTGDTLADIPGQTQAELQVTALTISPEGSRIATGVLRGPIRIFDARTHAQLRAIETPQTAVYDVCFSNDGRTLAAAGMSPGIALYDAQSGAMLASIPDAFQNWRVRFSPDGKLLAAARSRPDIELLDAGTLKLVRTLRGHGTTVLSIAFDPAGRTLASGGQDGTFRLWGVESGHSLVSMDLGVQVSDIAFVPGSSNLVTCGEQGQARLWHLDYYNRHIAGSMSYYLAKIGAGLPHPPRTDALLAWARKTTGNPACSFGDPTLAAPLNGNGLEKPLPPAE